MRHEKHCYSVLMCVQVTTSLSVSLDGSSSIVIILGHSHGRINISSSQKVSRSFVNNSANVLFLLNGILTSSTCPSRLMACITTSSQNTILNRKR